MLRRLGLGLVIIAAAPLVLSVAYIWVTPVSTLMLARMATGEPVVRRVVPIDALPAHVPALLIASEDGQFCRHWGVDWRELWAQVTDEDGPSRGASTLTMQIARNLFLWQGDGGITSLIRKGLEIPLALVIDRVWSKQRQLEIYLNIAEWGPEGEFGIGAGASAAFEVRAEALSIRQAALLVSILPNPKLREAADPGPRVRRKAEIITRRAGGVRTDCL